VLPEPGPLLQHTATHDAGGCLFASAKPKQCGGHAEPQICIAGPSHTEKNSLRGYIPYIAPATLGTTTATFTRSL
jgi:hypothetical protein